MKIRAFLSVLLLATVALGAAPPVHAQPAWVPLGPDAGQPVESLVVLPGDAVYAVGVSGVFGSSAGDRWGLLNAAPGGEPPLGATGSLDAAVRADSPLYLLAEAPEAGLYRSRDGGETWTLLESYPSDAPTLFDRHLAVAPSDPSRLYLLTRDGARRSSDGGDTWTDLAPYPIPPGYEEDFRLGPVRVDPTDPDTVYGFVRLPFEATAPASTYPIRSTDAGANWETGGIVGNHDFPVNDAVLDPQDPDTIYVATVVGIYGSLDGGETWEPRSDGLPTFPSAGGTITNIPVFALAADPETAGVLYAGLRETADRGVDGGVYRSVDGGATWTSASEGLPLPVTVLELAVQPDDPDTLYAGTTRGVFRSTDGGDSWAPTDDRLPTPVASVAVDPLRPARLYTGSDDRRLFVSDDAGQSWDRTGDAIPRRTFDTVTRPIEVVTVAPGDPSVVFAAGGFFEGDEVVLVRSTDRGVTFERAPAPGTGDVREIDVDPRDATRVLAAVGNGGGVFVSTDQGASWRSTLSGHIDVLERAASNPDVLYAGTTLFPVPPDPTAQGVCRSDDNGESWTCSDSGLEEGFRISALAVDPRDAATVYAALQIGRPGDPDPVTTAVHRSADGGVTWTEIGTEIGFPEGPVIADLAIDPRAPRTIWAGTERSGVYRGTDAGATWTAVSAGLTHPRVTELAFAPNGRVLVAATGGGVFRFAANGANDPAPPADLDWITDPAIDGFRIKVRIGQGVMAPPIEATREPACIPETVCVSGALPGRSEVFVRIVGPKPNGFLWPTLVKLTTSEVEVWIEQTSTGEVRYYTLARREPGLRRAARPVRPGRLLAGLHGPLFLVILSESEGSGWADGSIDETDSASPRRPPPRSFTTFRMTRGEDAPEFNRP